MSDLLVHRESSMRDVLITAVSESAAGLVVNFVAREGEWFAPSEPGADPDGFVRQIRRIVGDGTFTFADRSHQKEAFEVLEAWRSAGKGGLVLTCDVDRQEILISDPATDTVVGVHMAREDLDRAS